MCPSSPLSDSDDEIARAYSPGQPISPKLHEILHSCYAYIPGQNVQCDPKNVVMYEKKECHQRKGADVLFADDHVQWIEPYSKVEELVAKTRTRLGSPAEDASTSSPAESSDF